jgi:hypothetical protein
MHHDGVFDAKTVLKKILQREENADGKEKKTTE